MRLALLGMMVLTTGFARAQYATGPGAVQYALTQPDGARVSLTMVIIGRVDTAGVSVHEWWDKTTSIPVLFSPPPGLFPGQTIDLEGIMTTLPRGGRAVLCDRIAYYLDRFGYLAPAVPPLKGFFDASVWPTRGWVEVRPSVFLFSLSSPEMNLLLDDPQPPGEGDPPPLAQMTLPDHSIAKAKSAGDDDPIPESLTGKIVTAGTNQFSGCFYVEEPDRSCGIRVVPTSGTYVPGDVVTISAGTMATSDDGERFIDEATVSVTGSGEVLPLGLPNRDIGGCDFADGQTILQAGVLNGRGLNNIGLLVKTWGKITYADPNGQFIYIDDGSALADGFVDGNSDPVLGVRVAALDLAAGNSITLPAQVGAIVRVVGISSCATVNQTRARMIRVRSQADVPLVMYVKPDGNDNNNGSTWALAKRSVQGALNAASVGAEIWVAHGTYAENVTLADGVGLYGGFVGNETLRQERNILGNPTILDGGASDSVVTCPSGLTSSTVIDGFTIRNGRAQSGAGIKCVSSSPTITHNMIAGNTAYTDTAGIASGGGIYCSGGSPLIAGNVIHSNHAEASAGAEYGAGIYCESCGSARVVNNTISDNTHGTGPWSHGGGIYSSGSSLLFANNIVVSNTSGVYVSGGTIEVVNNCVYGNTAYRYSGITDPTGTDGNISDDPLLGVDGVHLRPDSPSVGAGSNGASGMPAADIDSQSRVQYSTVDIGADESDGCWWFVMELSANPPYAAAGDTIPVTAQLTGGDVEGCVVCFSVSDATITEFNGSPVPSGTRSYCGIADENGSATALISRETPGQVTVTVRGGNSCGTGFTTERIRMWFYDPEALTELFFCIDATESMGQLGEHRATESVAKFLIDMTAQGIFLKVGGVKFNEPGDYSLTEEILIGAPGQLASQFVSLSQFTDVASLINSWVQDDYSPGGGTAPELQLDALHLAIQDMDDHSTSENPNRYIVLITDNRFHQLGDGSNYTQLTKQGVIGELAASGCTLYISLWQDPADPWLNQYYADLLGDTGEFDPCVYDTGIPAVDMYPLARLREQIAGD